MEKKGKEENSFAKGLCFYKLVWIFFICGVMGVIFETLYCRISMNQWMSRSSLIHIPFSIVWGGAGVVLTSALYWCRNKKTQYVFWAGTLVGGLFEYLAGWFIELFFHTSFWDYSHIPLNIGGKTHPLFAMFYGLVAILWVRKCYPKLSDVIEKIPPNLGKTLTWVLITIFAMDMFLSASAVFRFVERKKGITAVNIFTRFLDRRYTDELLKRIYPCMKLV